MPGRCDVSGNGRERSICRLPEPKYFEQGWARQRAQKIFAVPGINHLHVTFRSADMSHTRWRDDLASALHAVRVIFPVSIKFLPVLLRLVIQQFFIIEYSTNML